MPPDAAALEEHRPALTGHCYRMLGSPADADDAVQETMVRAWRSLARFDGRSSLRTWLSRIATNVCLDALNHRSRRARVIDEGPPGTVDDPLEELPAETWLEPLPDAKVLSSSANPAERAALRESIRLAFVAALQRLPPRQRAALLLTEVVGCSAAETAETLVMSVAAVNSALQRARATMEAVAHQPVELTPEREKLVEGFVSAFERYDVDALTTLLTADVALSMPPYRLWLRGKKDIADWLLGRGSACRGSRLVPTAASGAPAFAQYKQDGSPWALVVLEPSREGIGEMTFFLDTARLFPQFGMPMSFRGA